jgi:hypothetical protein
MQGGKYQVTANARKCKNNTMPIVNEGKIDIFLQGISS